MTLVFIVAGNTGPLEYVAAREIVAASTLASCESYAESRARKLSDVTGRRAVGKCVELQQ